MIILKLTSVLLINLIVLEAQEICGKFNFGGGTIVGGKTLKRGEFPWLVSIFYGERSIFICGGTLISTQHVLTGNQIREI